MRFLSMIEAISKDRSRNYIYLSFYIAIYMWKENDNSTNYHVICPVRCFVCGHFINDSYFKEKEITR